MPIVEHKIPGEPDEIAINIARQLTASPAEFLSNIHQNREFCRFMWLCLSTLIEEVGYVAPPTGAGTKTIVCYVPLGREVDPTLNPQQIEILSRALKSVHWETDVERKGKNLFYKLEGVLSASDKPHLDKRCILPTPIQFSHIMRPENEALTRVIWMFGDNILRSKKKFVLGTTPGLWVSQDVLSKAVQVYQQRGWNVRPAFDMVAGRKSHYLDFTLPSQESLPNAGVAQ